MIFLIFVATFVTLACLVLPLATLAAFAIMRGEPPPAWRDPETRTGEEAGVADRLQRGAPREETRASDRSQRSALREGRLARHLLGS